MRLLPAGVQLVELGDAGRLRLLHLPGQVQLVLVLRLGDAEDVDEALAEGSKRLNELDRHQGAAGEELANQPQVVVDLQEVVGQGDRHPTAFSVAFSIRSGSDR